MKHYLDNSATTEPSEASLRGMNEAALVWGNPSSVHSIGQTAANALKEYRAALGKTLGMPRFSQDRLVLTSCGTESNNIVMLGCAHAKKRNPEKPGTVIISDGEHPSVDLPAAQLEKEGYDLVRVPTKNGVLDLDFLKRALDEAKAPVVLAAFMLVNNETGAVYDVKSAARLVKQKFPDALVHCDAVQGYMKLKFTPMTLGVDTMTASSHKIHSIRGAGLLYISAEVIKRRNISAIMPGGGQEGGLRSGTENLVSVGAFAAAATEEYTHLAENMAKVEELRKELERQLREKCPAVAINLPAGDHLANIANLYVPGVKSETMLNYLSGREIYVSAGSACSSHAKAKSAALAAFGLDDGRIDSSIRVSISHRNAEEDITALCDGLRDGMATLQKKH